MKQKTNQQPKKQALKESALKPSMFEQIENFLQQNKWWALGSALALSLVFSIILFNPDVSYGGDDSAYIVNGYNFLKNIAFPSWQGPFYPMVLSLVIAVFGVNLIVLKFVSVIFTVLAVYFIFKVFSQFANYTIATIVGLATSTSLLLNTYASTTYTEPLFYLLQAIFLYLTFRFISTQKASASSWKKLWKPVLALVFISYFMFQTKNLAIIVIPFVLAILLFEKHFKASILYASFIAIIHVLFSLYKNVVWKVSSVGFEDQLKGLLYKSYYNPDEGTENFIGLLKRFWMNAELYLSKHIIKMTGMKPVDTLAKNTNETIILIAIFVLSAALLWRKNKSMRYLFLYLGAMVAISFIMLQTIWDQERIVMIYFPYIIGIVLFAIYKLFSYKPAIKFQILPIVIASLLIISITAQTVRAFDFSTLSRRFTSGNYVTYTPDWQNYMLASQWAGENLPDSVVVICRKPQMSWIAAEGKDIFKGIFRVEHEVPDSVVALFQRMGATHVILGNLRINPKMKTDRTITTIRNSMSLINGIYPGAFTLLQTIGDDEKAYVFSVNYADEMPRDIYLENLDAAIIVNPRNRFAINTKANYLFASQQYPKAIEYLNFGLHNHPEEIDFQYSIGLCYFQLKDYTNASEAFQKTIKLDSSHQQAWYNLAVSYYYLQDFENSRKALMQAKANGFEGTTTSLERELSKLIQ